jgi:hypothetical protein
MPRLLLPVFNVAVPLAATALAEALAEVLVVAPDPAGALDELELFDEAQAVSSPIAAMLAMVAALAAVRLRRPLPRYRVPVLPRVPAGSMAQVPMVSLRSVR